MNAASIPYLQVEPSSCFSFAVPMCASSFCQQASFGAAEHPHPHFVFALIVFLLFV
jgi:hypothetical protein